MSDKYFVDTNILMYAHDTAAGSKHVQAKALVEDLWRDRSGVVSTQVLQELSVNLRKKAGRPLDTQATREIIADYLTWRVIVNRGESILGAARSRKALSGLVLGRSRASRRPRIGRRGRVLRGLGRWADLRCGPGRQSATACGVSDVYHQRRNFSREPQLALDVDVHRRRVASGTNPPGLGVPATTLISRIKQMGLKKSAIYQ